MMLTLSDYKNGEPKHRIAFDPELIIVFYALAQGLIAKRTSESLSTRAEVRERMLLCDLSIKFLQKWALHLTDDRSTKDAAGH